MLVTILESKVFRKLISEIEDLLSLAKVRSVFFPGKNWVSNEEVQRVLKIPMRTLQDWRDAGKIGFSQIGSKIYYRTGELLFWLKSHYRKLNLEPKTVIKPANSFLNYNHNKPKYGSNHL